MTIRAEVIADSMSPQGIRLTTLQLRYPKFIHGEFMTHRVFSRNASSSRAIPVERLIKDVLDDPVYPSYWGANQKGMQADMECDAGVWLTPSEGMGKEFFEKRTAWSIARDYAIEAAQAFADAGYHKQIVNRLLEPFCHINVVVTATEWSNFFALRCHPDAQPEMRELAEAMRLAMAKSEPRPLDCPSWNPFGWHLPYVDVAEESKMFPQDLIEGGDGYSAEEGRDALIKLSVARCARVSYLTQDGRRPTASEDLALYERLAGSIPLHASPMEHQATPDELLVGFRDGGGWARPYLHGNLRGWCQYRKTLPGERQ